MKTIDHYAHMQATMEPEVTDAMCAAGRRAMGPFDARDATAAYACFRAMILAEPRYVRALLGAGLLETPHRVKE